MKNATNNVPKVSIVSISYNQEKYIAKTLESFVMQQSDFGFEVVIADDCSTDKTAEIIKEYATKYPAIFKPILRKKNVGILNNLFDAMRQAKGQYIALCEGDDYWTDDKKLQLQANFLDKNPEYALCFHPVKVIFEKNDQEEYIFPEIKPETKFTVEELLKKNYIQTNSVMYRKQDYSYTPTGILPIDWYLHLLHARFGKIGLISEVMSVYRRHPGGVWWNFSKEEDDLWKKHGIAHITLYAELLKIYGNNPVYKEIIFTNIGNVLTKLVDIDKKEGTDLVGKAILNFPNATKNIIMSQHRHDEQMVRPYKEHMDEQAKIITHLENELADKSRQFEHAMGELTKTASELDKIRKSIVWKTMNSPKLIRKKLKNK